MYKTQPELVLGHLQKRSITQAEAMPKYGIFGLSKVISTLRQRGHKIDGVMTNVTVGGTTRRMMRYTLRKEAKE
ncbi:MAG: helix-turn-helix domain-containing protein [Proteobacteria bacterium]|nr:helix-turn-helix domain-containing protein [Pseudomonadota bacterium]MCL2306781.1 helix-turn-helix domain-containing protein [Pseudomonadota bacterium]